MEKKIKEVQDYFTKRIENCDFELVKIEPKKSGWVWFVIKIDGYDFSFAINREHKSHCPFDRSFIRTKTLNKSQLDKLIAFAEDKEQELKAEKIKKLKKELAKLEL